MCYELHKIMYKYENEWKNMRTIVHTVFCLGEVKVLQFTNTTFWG